MTTYVVYTRVSTEDQARQGFSLPEQVAACRSRVEQLAAPADRPPAIVEFSDDLSGDFLERPGLSAALALVRTRTVAAFICMDPDRLARKLMHQLLITDEIEQSGCRLEFVDHEYRQDPEGQLFYQMRGAIAEYEKAKILQRMSRGAHGKARAGGVPTYVAPYGYRFRAGQGHAQAVDVVVPLGDEAPWVETIFRWCAEEGLGPNRIGDRLNRLGVPAKRGGPWRPQVVRRLLRNPTYATGLMVWGRRDHRGIYAMRRLDPTERRRRHMRLTPVPRPEGATVLRVTPLVDQALWDHAQRVLAGFHGADRLVADPRRRRLLTSLGRCGVCGGALMYFGGRKISCGGRIQGKECTLPSKSAAAVEDAVWSHVRTWLKEAMEVVPPARPSVPPARPPHQEQAALELLIAQKRQEVERWGRLYAEGRVPEAVALPALEHARSAWREAEQRLASLGAPASVGPALLPAWTDIVSAARTSDAIDRWPEGQRTAVVHGLVAYFVVRPSPRRAPPKVEVVAVWDASDDPPSKG